MRNVAAPNRKRSRKPTSAAPKKRAVWPMKKNVALNPAPVRQRRPRMMRRPPFPTASPVAFAVNVPSAVSALVAAALSIRVRLVSRVIVARRRVVRAALFACVPMLARVVLVDRVRRVVPVAHRVRVVCRAIARVVLVDPVVDPAVVLVLDRGVARVDRVRLRRWIRMI